MEKIGHEGNVFVGVLTLRSTWVFLCLDSQGNQSWIQIVNHWNTLVRVRARRFLD